MIAILGFLHPQLLLPLKVFDHKALSVPAATNQNAMQPPAFRLTIVDCNVISFFDFSLAANIHKSCVVGRATAANSGA